MNSPSSSSAYGSGPASPNTTYVQLSDPSTFRAVVQKLTGATEDPSCKKLPVTLPARYANPKPASVEVGPRRPAFKLHERRHSAKKLDQLNLVSSTGSTTTMCGSWAVMMSPVSPFEFLARGSPVSPCGEVEKEDDQEEERAIAEKGFYLHPSPLHKPPQLLPLFPLHSPS